MYDAVTVTKRQIKGTPQYSGKQMLTIDIAYPRIFTKGSPAGQLMSVCYDHIARRFYVYASRQLFAQAVQNWKEAQKKGYPFHEYQAGMTYEVPFNQKNLLSIYYDQSTYTGGAHGNWARHANTWRPFSAQRLSLSNFFNSSAYRNIVFRAIFAQIQQNPENYFEDYQQKVFEHFDERNFYLKEKGFIFFFPLYSIAPYVSGVPEFLVPYELFGDLLKICPV